MDLAEKPRPTILEFWPSLDYLRNFLKVEDEAKSVASSISQKERTGRVDYRDVFTLTIDP